MADYYRFRVRLLHTDAELWREFLLVKTATFAQLHYAIQDACGWADCHLYDFRTKDRRTVIAGIPDEDGFEDSDPNAESVTLESYFGSGRKKKCIYTYDFGDDWGHEVSLEGTEKHEENFLRRLLDGHGTFPPEDCGSIPGYERCVAAVTGKGWVKAMGSAAERAELLDAIGDWRPDSFNLNEAKKQFDM